MSHVRHRRRSDIKHVERDQAGAAEGYSWRRHDRRVSGTRFGRHCTARRVAKQGHGMGRGTCRCRHFYVGPSPAGMVTGGAALTIQRRRSAAVARPIMLVQAYDNCDRLRSIALDRRALPFLPVFRPCRDKADWSLLRTIAIVVFILTYSSHLRDGGYSDTSTPSR